MNKEILSRLVHLQVFQRFVFELVRVEGPLLMRVARGIELAQRLRTNPSDVVARFEFELLWEEVNDFLDNLWVASGMVDVVSASRSAVSNCYYTPRFGKN